MPSGKLKNYLRAYRKRSGLSQNDVASLIGTQTGASISRYERFSRQPTLQTALAYEVIFGIPAQELFSGLFEGAKKATLARANTLAEELRALPSARRPVHKLNLLQEILARSQLETQPHTLS
ncbi:MAG: helix-turn-helix transcriptional regulator [Terriglobia bacterium]